MQKFGKMTRQHFNYWPLWSKRGGKNTTLWYI